MKFKSALRLFLVMIKIQSKNLKLSFKQVLKIKKKNELHSQKNMFLKRKKRKNKNTTNLGQLVKSKIACNS